MSSSNQSRLDQHDDTSTDVPWCCLPKLALQIVFKHVPQGLRVGRPSSCALVCTSWAEAAAVATDSIDLDTCARADRLRLAGSLQLWLHNHGDNLTKLHVTATYVELTSLPCPKLRDLCVKGPPQGCYDANHFPPNLPCNIVQQLTRLELAGGLSDELLCSLGPLSTCKHLVLGRVSQVDQECLASLQALSGLTSLHSSGLTDGFHSSTCLGLSNLTALQHLELKWACTLSRWELQPSHLDGSHHTLTAAITP